MTSNAPDAASLAGASAPSRRSPNAGSGRTASGLAFALVSASAFGLSGSLARGLLESGWSAGAAAAVRMGVAAAVVALPTALAMRGRWSLVRRAAPTVLLYGLLAVAGAQLCYFYAVQTLQVGVRGSRSRSSRSAYSGPSSLRSSSRAWWAKRRATLNHWPACLASTGSRSGPKTSTATNAMTASSDSPTPHTASILELVGGGEAQLHAGEATSAPGQTLGDVALPWWLLVGLLGVVTAALAYVTGIAAGRRLGSRVASFVALSEVLMAVLFAWLLLDELPTTAQLLGGLLVLAGVVLVKVGEPRHVEEHGATSPTVEPLPPT